MHGPAPFSEPPAIPTRPPAPAPAPKRRLPLWAGILIGALLTLAVLFGGGVYLVYVFGWKAFAEQATTAMNDEPMVQRCIGKIEHSAIDFVASGNDDRENGFAFRIKGSKGSGIVDAVFTTVDADHEQIDEGELKMDDGRTFPLARQGSTDDDDDDEDDIELPTPPGDGCPGG